MNPTDVILTGSARTYTATDVKGRQYLVRPPTALDTLRLFKAAGPVLAQNEPWLAMASLASSVQAINGVPVPAPVSEIQIEGLIERLGEDGLAAIASSFPVPENCSDSKELLGNLRGTPS